MVNNPNTHHHKHCIPWLVSPLYRAPSHRMAPRVFLSSDVIATFMTLYTDPTLNIQPHNTLIYAQPVRLYRKQLPSAFKVCSTQRIQASKHAILIIPFCTKRLFHKFAPLSCLIITQAISVDPLDTPYEQEDHRTVKNKFIHRKLSHLLLQDTGGDDCPFDFKARHKPRRPSKLSKS